MKKIIYEDTTESLQKLLGEYVTLYCLSFIYAGKLIGVNEQGVLLENASIVYETGAHANKKWSVAEKFPGNWHVRISKIESYGVFKSGD